MKKTLTLLLTSLLTINLFACKNGDDKPTSTVKETIKIIAPSGAPTLSQVKIAYDALDNDFTIDNYKIQFESTNGPQGLQAAITNKSHDIVIAPINLGSSLYNNTKSYKYAANITDGNLFFASTKEITIEDLKTANLVFFGEGTINEAVINKILEYNNITRNDITFLSDANMTNAQLAADKEENTIYLVAEPSLSKTIQELKSQNKTVYKIDVQEEFYKATNGLTFLQAGVFVKSDLDKDFVNAYLTALEDGIDFINEQPDKASEYATELELGLPPKNVLTAAIPGCNIHFRLAEDCKDSLNALCELNPKLFGGHIANDFYF